MFPSRASSAEDSAGLVGYFCTKCGRAYPADGLPYRCPQCAGVYDRRESYTFREAKVEPDRPGIWRFRHTFGLPVDVSEVSLGEGNTPLLPAEVMGRRVWFKCEHLNPTGSFKDRGSALIAALLRSRGSTEAIEDSSGNAGASFAAYAARAGIKARIFVPASASGPKRKQIEAYGAELSPVEGSRTDVSEAAKRVAASGVAYASHAYLPFNLPGYATIAYEIFGQLGRMPAAIVMPAGQGGLLLGIHRGFEALKAVGNADHLPRMIGLQARACAPLWAMYSQGPAAMDSVSEGRTLAEGVRVRFPVRGDAVLQAVQATQGKIVAVDEIDILRGRDELARRGFYVEPTSAIVWSGLAQTLSDLPDPVVVILTGTGFKYQG